jgi:hypothetical protein
MLNECIKRLQRGVPVTKITDWILGHEERGGLGTEKKPCP